MSVGLIILLVFLYFYTVTCTFFTVQIAAVKGRGRLWGWLGFLLGIVGFSIMCFIPNAKGVEGETNPIKTAFKKLRGISPIAVWILLGGVVVVVGGTVLAVTLSRNVGKKDYSDQLEGVVEEVVYISPSKVTGTVVDVFAGDRANYAVTMDGTLYGWGSVGLSPLDETGILYKQAKKICKAGDTVYLLASSGTLYARGDNTKALIPGQSAEYVENFVEVEKDVKDISLSENAGAILKSSGNLYVVGTNTYGQLGRGVGKMTNTDTKLAGNVAKVVLTSRSLYYLDGKGNVFGVGNNAYGQFGLGHKDALEVPVSLTGNCTDFAAGDDFLMVLKSNGTVWTAGNNGSGQLGRIPVNKTPVYEEGEEAPVPAPAVATRFGQIELEGVTRIVAGPQNAFAFIGNDLYGWGRNHLGQLGSGNAEFLVPILIQKDISKMAAGRDCTLLLTLDGKLLGAGNTANYQLGPNNSGKGFGEIAEVKS